MDDAILCPFQWANDNENPPFTVKKVSPWAELEPGTARSVGQRFIHWGTGAPNNNNNNKPDSIVTMNGLIQFILIWAPNTRQKWVEILSHTYQIVYNLVAGLKNTLN